MKPARLLCLAALVPATLAAGCGGGGVADLASQGEPATGAQLFAANCAGCHTLDDVVARGSSTDIRDQERVDGPNFNTRPEEVEEILYAIRNGGFSGAIMPENIVVGEEAQKVAEYLAANAGKQAQEARAGEDESDSGGSGGAGP
jgi:mono/diheme cytochrome c family protein